MPITTKLTIVCVIVINCLSYLLMAYDKFQSKRKGNRVSENTLFLMAFILGAPGIYLGMYAPLYHKAAKPKFKFVVPFLIVVNVISVFSLFKFILN